MSWPKRDKNNPGKSKKQEIMDAAMAVFAHYGYDGTSMEKIAQAAACTRPLVIQYLGNKEALAKYCFTQFIDAFFKNLRVIHDESATYAEVNRLARQQFILHRDAWRFLLGVMCVPALDELRADLMPRYLEITREGLEGRALELQRPESIPQFTHLIASLHFRYLVGGDEENYIAATDNLISRYIKPEYLK